MYINKKKHILTKVIFGAAFCNLIFELSEGAQRFFLRKKYSFQPDMLEMTMWQVQLAVSFIKLGIMVVLFVLAWNELRRIKRLVGQDDLVEMAKLQTEAVTDSISTLSAYSIEQLLQIWAAIFIGAELVYDVTALVYRDFIGALSRVFDMSDQGMADAFVSFYNNTHGFKYMGMLIALFLGIFVTGVFLKDRILKAAAFLVAVLFTLAFVILRMHTVTIFDRSIGIVWTSVIFHLTETVGLVCLSIYMAKKYKGL